MAARRRGANSDRERHVVKTLRLPASLGPAGPARLARPPPRASSLGGSAGRPAGTRRMPFRGQGFTRRRRKPAQSPATTAWQARRGAIFQQYRREATPSFLIPREEWVSRRGGGPWTVWHLSAGMSRPGFLRREKE